MNLELLGVDTEEMTNWDRFCIGIILVVVGTGVVGAILTVAYLLMNLP